MKIAICIILHIQTKINKIPTVPSIRKVKLVLSESRSKKFFYV